MATALTSPSQAILKPPYEAKVIRDGTTARMVLMFLRELMEQPPSYNQFQQTHSCPMMKCYEKFPEPLLLVQHLLSCPELPNGEFDCDKCSNWHQFPTSEKDWSMWQGWSGKLQRHPQHMHVPERKRSFSSKMRETFTIRKKDPRKQSFDGMPFSPTSRPGTSASGASSIMTMSKCPEHEAMVFPAPVHAAGQGFMPVQKPQISTTAPQIDTTMFWSVGDADPMEGLRSAVSSIAPSSIAPSTYDTDTTKGTSTTNTSQTTLFNPALGPYQSPDVMTPPFIFPPQPTFDNGSTPLGGHPQSSAMSIDEPLHVNDAALSPADTATPSDSRTWWGAKADIDTPRPTPVASPFYGMAQPMAHNLSRTMSHETIQEAMPGLFQRALSEGTQIEALSPHASHAHHNHHSDGSSMTGRSSPTDELVCDECQWKPRGVRENLRGYLRKHKNTHKGLRLPCDVVGCTKTFSRLDNLKKHKKDKHGIDEPGSVLPLKRVAEEFAEHVDEEPTENKRPAGLTAGLTEADIRNASGDYSMLWPALHF
ncbi:hypothetical protein OQA88_5755 [Cercophora sp. LCS_1]